MIPCQCRHSISLTAIDPNMLDDGAIPKCILSYVIVFVFILYGWHENNDWSHLCFMTRKLSSDS